MEGKYDEDDTVMSVNCVDATHCVHGDKRDEPMLYRVTNASKNKPMREMHHPGVIFSQEMLHSLLAGAHVIDPPPPSHETRDLPHAVLMAAMLRFLHEARECSEANKQCRATVFGFKPVPIKICTFANPIHTNINSSTIDDSFCMRERL